MGAIGFLKEYTSELLMIKINISKGKDVMRCFEKNILDYYLIYYGYRNFCSCVILKDWHYTEKLKHKVYKDRLLTNICFRGKVVHFRASMCKFAAVV